ncbi:MAG: alpha/beta hydrolase [Nitriliruptor sp.]|uniref:alpha/beta hydrolase n=1 Tax=Nitriliruptor sp. TaxID=2448056 RepID=UPI0034A05FDC
MTRASDGTELTRTEVAARAFTRGVVRRTLDGSLSMPAARKLQDALGGSIGTLRHRVEVRHGHIAGVPVEVLRARGRAAHREGDPHVLLYVHGGGFVVGSPRSHRGLTAALAGAADATVVVADYRLAPEHPFPAAADDVRAVHGALLERAPQRLTLAGDSAGGNLAIGLAVALRDAGDTSIAAVGAISPFVDLTTPEGSWDTSDDPLLVRGGFDAVGDYLAGAYDPTDPLVSPRWADLTSLPPTLVQVGGAEALRDDAFAYVDAAAEAGGDVHLQVWPGMWHVHQVFVGMLPAADRAVADLGRFLATGALPADARPAGRHR